MALTRYNKSYPCTVCGTGTKGCSFDDSTNIHLCRGENLNGEYKLLKDLQNGFRSFIKASESFRPFTAEEKAQWAKDKKKRQQEKQQKFAKLLSREARNIKYQSLTDDLGLTAIHVEELEAKGLHSAKDLGFRSVRKYQKILPDVSGIAGFQKQKYVGMSGILCPIRDVKKRTLGYQVKTSVKDFKYVWLKSEGYSSHLRNGELPINVAQSGNRVIGFCEGILKSTIAAQKHSSTFIGASTVGSTPQQIKEVIEHFKLKEVYLFVDSGSILNASVVACMKNFNNVVEGLGLSVKVADYGQWFDKSVGDIDEIDSLDSIEYRDFSFYYSCHLDPSKYTQKLPEMVEKVHNELSTIFSKYKVNNKATNFTNNQDLAVNYVKGNLPSDPQGIIVEFDGSATDIYTEAIAKGYSVVFDSSAPGSGKTYAASQLDDVELFKYGVTKMVYASQSTRDVSNKKLEQEFTVIPSRHGGLDEHPTKLTPLGNPVMEASKGSNPKVASNCKWLNLFNLTRSKNIDIDICDKCDHKRNCSKFVGEGFGFKKQVMEASKDRKLRSTVSGLSDSSVHGNTVLIVDEYSRVPWVNSTMIGSKDVSNVLDILSRQTSDITLDCSERPYQKLGRFILSRLSQALSDVQNKPEYLYGMSLYQLRERLDCDSWDKDALKELVTLIEITTGQENDENFEQVQSRDLKSEEMLDILLYPEWFSLFIDTVTRKNPSSSIVVKRSGLLDIQVINQRLVNVFNSAQTVIFQDATGSKQDLALRLGIDADSILEVRQKQAERAKVTLTQVIGAGRVTQSRTEACQKRLDAVRDWFYDFQGSKNVGCIDFKKFARNEDLVHFVDGRGSNRFQHKEVVISFGVPVQNLSEAQSEYQILNRTIINSLEDEGFQQYLSNIKAAEIIQEAGRLRANRRIDEELEYVIVSDEDLNFMNNQGFEVKKEHITEFIDDSLCNAAERLRLNVLTSIRNLLDKGVDLDEIRQVDVRSDCNASQSSISKLAKKFGGWDEFKKVIHQVIEGCDGEGYTDSHSKEVEKAKAFLPFLLDESSDYSVEEMKQNMPENATPAHWKALYADIPYPLMVRFVQDIIKLLPPILRRNFLLDLKQHYQI